MKKEKDITLKTIALLLALAPAAYSQAAVPNVTISTASKSVAEIYRPANGRDPMVISSVYASQTENRKLVDSKQPAVTVSSFTVKNLVLSGIIEYSNRKEALLKDQATGLIYVLKNGILYDGRKNRVAGVKGSVKGKQVTLISDGNKDEPFDLFIKE